MVGGDKCFNSLCSLDLGHPGPCKPNPSKVDEVLGSMREPEKINHPSHYGGDTTYEAIKVIEAWGLGFCLGNAVKYICRAGKKGEALEDLKKARWYLERAITNLERGDATSP